MSAIFVSYRRADSGGHAGRLYDRLRHWFDEEAVFYDLGSIDAGDMFPTRLEDGVRSARIVLVLIGADWVASLNDRAGKPAVDYVRREVALALQLHARDGRPAVIPVLVGGAGMPSGTAFGPDLQADLSAVAALDAHEFRGKQDDWDNQFVRLRHRIAQVAGVPAPRFRAPAGTARPFRVIDHSLSPHFQDPDDLLARIRESLEGASAVGPARVALFGMGGVGKTQLALKYTHEYRDTYAGVWWFRSEATATLQLDARDACIEAPAHMNDAELPSAALKRWLATQPGTWLLVFDNAEDTASLRPHLPDGGRHHVIVTSRNPAWGGLAQVVELDVWTAEQAAAFLGQRLPGSAHVNRLELAGDLDGLPLALEQAAGYVESTGTSIADYRELLTGIETGDLILDEGRAATGYERSVAATLSLAFERLSPAAAQLLQLCSFAAPEPLPERFFAEAREKLPNELGAASASPLEWNRVVGELLRFGLADRVPIAALDGAPARAIDRTEKALAYHRLTQQVGRARLALPERDGRGFQELLAAVCPEDAKLPANWPRFAVLSQHVTQLDRFTQSAWLDKRGFSWLIDRVASYLRFGPALFGESSLWLRRAVAIDQAELGDEHPDTLTSMSNLAGTLWAQGDLPGARELEERVLELRRRVLGDEHPHTLTSMSNLGGTLRAQGDLPGARELEERVLELRRRVLGDEHPDTLGSMINLANTLREQGDLPRARELQERVLELTRRVLGDRHPDMLASMSNLAGTLWAQGDLPGARELQERVLELMRRVLGDEHPHTLTSMSNLGGTLGAQGDLPGARELDERVLELRRRVLGDEHPDTLTSMNNLANTLREQGDLPGARELQERVLEHTRRVLGDEHPDTLRSMSNLASTLRAQGDLPGAREMHERVLELMRRVLGDEHPDTLRSMSNLANTLWAQGDLPGARELHERVLELRRRVLGDEHPDTLASMNNLAITLWHSGELQHAVELMKIAATGRTKLLGVAHPDTQSSADALAEMRAALGTPA